MDAVISIGGQSFIDGIVRLLGPALQPLRTPMPIALPGLTNGTLSIRRFEPVLPGSRPGEIELEVEFELAGEVLLLASAAVGNVTLTPGTGDINLGAATGTVAQPVRNGTLATSPGSGTVGPATALTLDALSGTVQLAGAPDAALNLAAIAGTLQFPAGVGTIALPFPAVVPVAVDLSRGGPLVARVSLAPLVNGGATGGADAPIDITTGFGLDFDFSVANLVPPAPPAAFAATLRTEITQALNAVATQLLNGLPAVAQPVPNLQNIADDLTTALAGAVTSTLTDAFTGLKARTGRLIFPTPGAGSSCDVRALPTAGKTRLAVAADGSIVLQVGFDRLPIAATDTFSAFTPTGIVDTGVAVSNFFVRDLLACLLERAPNLTLLSGAPALVNTPPAVTATWPAVTLTLGPFAFSGSLVLTIAGTPGAPGPASPKAVRLDFALADTFSWGIVGQVLSVSFGIRLPIAFDLNNLAALTALRLTARPVRLAFSFGAGSGLTAWLVVMAVLIGATAFVGPVPIIAPFLIAGAALVGILPHVVLAMIGRVLFNHIDQVLAPLRLLQSPAAVPSGIFEAFGDLVATTLVLDDLYGSGVLRTPTTPWTVLPLSNRGKPPRPAPGDRPRPQPGTTPVPPTAPGTIPVAPRGTTTGTRP